MGVLVDIVASQIGKQRIGYSAISITHPFDTSEPSIRAGSKVEVSSALYEFTADEAGTGWAGIADNTVAYMSLIPVGSAMSWEYDDTAPTWNDEKQGWYIGDNRVFGSVYKVSVAIWGVKILYIKGRDRLFTLEKDIGDWNMDVTAEVDLVLNCSYANIKRVNVYILNDTPNATYPLTHNVANDLWGYYYVELGPSGAQVDMFRITGKGFDGPSFNATSYNRGFVTFDYEA
jgi:hypothetical protein